MAVTKPNRDPMTLEQIRAALPTHIILTPGVHKLKVCDEEGYEDRIEERDYWARIHDSLAGLPVNTELTRRPIPEHILDNQAFWIWFDTLKPNTPLIGMALSLPEFKAGRLYDKWLLEQMGDV